MRKFTIILLLAVSAPGCSEEEEPRREATPPVESVTVEEDRANLGEHREAFGLPLPPEVISVRRSDQRVRASTHLSMDELEQFFERRLRDYEVLRVGRRLEVVPLRPHSPRAVARHFINERTHIVVEYRPAPDLAEQERQRAIRDKLLAQQDEGDLPEEISRRELRDQRRRAIRRHQNEPDWLRGVQGEPVELRTSEGELMAPGARWGEPYTPPEGSPLHTPRNEQNFGRPFGDWSSH